jgi:hypothetical protein
MSKATTESDVGSVVAVDLRATDDSTGRWLPKIGPLHGVGDQSRTNGIIDQVLALLIEAFFLPQPMLKEVFLPSDAAVVGAPSLPVTDDLRVEFHLVELTSRCTWSGMSTARPQYQRSFS